MDDYSDVEYRQMQEGRIFVESEGDTGAGQRIIGKGYIIASIEEVRDVLLDFNHYSEFIPGFRESSLLHEKDIPQVTDRDTLRRMTDYFDNLKCELDSSGTCFWYQRIDFPWPVPDRCAILQVEFDSTEIRSQQIVGMFKHLSGGWKLWPDGEGVVAVYHTKADLGIPIPGFVQRIGLDIMLPDVYRAIGKRILENRKGPR